MSDGPAANTSAGGGPTSARHARPVRPIEPASEADVAVVAEAIDLLRRARDLLRGAAAC